MNDNEQEVIPQTIEQRIREIVPLGAYQNSADQSESYPAPPLPSDERGSSSSTYPLQLYRSSGAGKIRAGSVAGFSIPTTTIAGSGAIYVSINVSMAYSATTAIWSATGASLATGGAYTTPSASILVVPVGIITFSGAAVSITAQESGGNQWVARTGNLSGYVDANGSISPLNP